MSNAVMYLEFLGQGSAASVKGRLENLTADGIAAEVLAAMFSGDLRKLGDLIGARAEMLCMIAVPDEKMPGDEPGEDGVEEPEEDEPRRE